MTDTYTHQTNQRTSDSRLHPRLIRGFILAVSCWVLSTPLTTIAGSAAAFSGCLLACLWMDARAHDATILKLRTTLVFLLVFLAVALSVLIAESFTSSDLAVSLLGPMASYQAGQMVLWLSLAASTGLILRLLARRYGWGSLPELLFVASAFVITLSAHQRGMIDRPYFIGDFALIRGIDPSSILMAIGVCAVLSLAILLIMENNHRRLPYHFSVLALLCFSLLFYVQFFGMPTPRLTDDLGLTGQSSNSGSSQSDNPFRDGENDASDREAPVAIVLFRDDYEPESGAYYFRESAYSQFNGSLLWTAERNDLDQDLISEFPVSRIEVSEPVLAQDKRRSVTTTIGLLTPHRSPFGLDAPVRFDNAPNPNSLRFRQTYTVESLVPEFSFADLIGRQSGSADWTLAQWSEYLAMPDDPRYQTFAQQLVEGLREEFTDDPYAKALAVKSWLDQNGIYSLKNAHAYASDPAASFLFGDLTGYCVHFAYAATYLYRSLGIPARVGVGYSVPSANRAGGSALLIQAVNGHAWPEIFLQDLGWVIVDPAPVQSLVDMSVDPQDSLQQLLGDMLRDDAAFASFLAEQRGSSRISVASLLRATTALALALLAAAYLIRIYRAVIPGFTTAAAQYRVQYRAALDTLSSFGLTRRRGESREAFSRRVAVHAPGFMQLTNWHLTAAPGYGINPGGTVQLGAHQLQHSRTDWLEHRQRLRQELSAALPWWRRALALLHPSPWISSR
jgi:transglutaminase-like putative cysteine protease